jgi:hypothetical protein
MMRRGSCRTLAILSLAIMPLAWPSTICAQTETLNLALPANTRLLPYSNVGFRYTGFAPTVPSWQFDLEEPELKGTFRVLNDPQAKDIPVTVTEPTMRLLAGADGLKSGCETRQKNIAKSGEKTLTYGNGPTLASCTFNFSDDEKIMLAANTFMAMAQTMLAGEKLKRDKRFDHLGLDADLDKLVDQAKQKFAIEFQNIATILTNIAEDDELMAPSRRKAQFLLDFGRTQAAPPPSSAR